MDLIPALPLDLALDCIHRVPLQSLSTLQQVCSSWRALVSSPSFYEARQSKGYTDHQACIIQAKEEPSSPGKAPTYGISIYDEKRKAWDFLPPIHDFPNGLPLFCSCVAMGAHLFLLGGWDPSSWSVLTSVYIYDFSSSQWRRGAHMPTARSFFACASAGLGKIVVAGGHDDSKNALRSAEMYDVAKDEWESLPDMREERDECKAVMFNGKLMVVSGFSTESQGQFVSSAESFDFVDRKWEMVDNFWPAGRPPSFTVVFKDQLYALLDGKLVRYGTCDCAWETILTLAPAIKAPACVTPLQDGILVVGFSGTAQPFDAFLCRVGTGSNQATWQRVNGNACCGIVQQTACTIEV
eukprot:c21883_g3_i2 orf=75-1133(-)